MSFLKKVEVLSGAKEISKIEKWLVDKQDFGKEPDQVWAKDKVLYSYKTIIAKIRGNTLYLNTTKYSNTTSKLQSYIKNNAKDFTVVEKDEKFFKTSMPEKLGGK